MTSAERQKANREYYARRGRCYRCKEHPPVLPGKTLCPACRQKRREISQKWYQSRKQSGLCPACMKRPPTEGHFDCEACRQRRLALGRANNWYYGSGRKEMDRHEHQYAN